MPSASSNGWSCSQCTFFHSAPGNRCSMCNAMRVSKQQMADFIQGIPIPKEDNNKSSNSNKTKKKKKKNATQQQQQSSSSPVDVIAKKQAKRQRRTEQTILMLDVMKNIGSNDDGGGVGGGNHETAADNTHSKTAAAVAVASFSSTTGVVTTITGAVADSATPPLADASVTANDGGGGGSGGDTQQNNTLRAPFPPPKQRQQQQQQQQPKPPPVVSQKQQQQQKRRAQRQQQHQPNHHHHHRTSLAVLPFSPGPVPFHPDTANDWIFPLLGSSAAGFSKRQYQLDICATAVRHNTLVSLPTGLGKTLIAAVVLYNYHRWFPTGKVIFMATTLPLVQQQVQACYNVMGIPVHDTAVLTGKMSPARRVEIWKEKSVFFCTPQTVQKDLECHRLDANQIVCLVLDEAHRATGDFAYCKIVNHLFNINNNSSTDTENNNNSNNNNNNNNNAADTTTAAAGEMKKTASASAPKFRLLGLSATPGSTIKKIQEVVDALRINKVESRNDDDADVKKYIHERENEVIVVPQVSACRDVERLLGEMIGPLLDQLRNRGGFHERGGHATVLAYSVFNAKNIYVAKHGNNMDPLGIMPIFYAVDPLLRIRSDLHQQGIGVVRHKLLKLKNEPQRGLLKNLVRGPAFAALWDLVERSTCSSSSSSNAVSNNSSSISVADKLMNNPKLVKLREILTVHFEQARATGQSSRAIVFAQFRDCVAEIVFVLQDLAPLIRSRYFVGQGKGSDNNNNNNNRTDANAAAIAQHQVKGMTQAEQHEAIRQFRDDVFNVLVCTCIGEEGLDIGEVDLIVNFDSIKSPIRSIQRVGRTGRKRDGRVVWLVSEGEEERTFRAGEQAKRTLVHALRNPNSFRVIPTMPMLPNDPVLCERGMNVSAYAHMSQVEGHVEQKKTTMKRQQPRQSSSAGVTTTKTASSATTTRRKSWRLSNDAQARRASVLGMSNRISTYSIPAMKRRIILARRQQQQQQSTSRSSRATLGRCRLGRTASLLCQFEENNNIMQDAATVSENSRHRVAGSGRSSDLSLDAFFPLTSFPLTSSEDHFKKLAWGSLKAPPPPPPPNSTTAAASIIAPTSTSNNDSSCHYAKVVLPTAAPKASENATRSEEAALAVSHVGVAAREPSQMTTTKPQPLVVVNPYTSRIIPTTKQRVPDHCEMEMSNLAGGTNNGFSSSSSMLPVPEEFQLPTPEPSSGEESADDDDDDAPCVDFASGTAVLETNELNHCAAPNTTSGIVELNHRSIGHVESVGFPPRDASMNELNHHSPETFAGQGGGIEQFLDEVTATVPLPAATKGAAPAPEVSELNHASESENFGLDAARETINEDDAFSLPPQDSSSSDDSDDDEDDDANLSTLRAPKENTSVEAADAAEHQPTNDHPRVRFSLDNSTAFTADSFNRNSLDPDPDEGTESVHVRRRGRKTRTILDTPDSMSFTETSAVRQPSKPEVRLSLDTTFTSDSSNYHSLEPDLDESAEFLHVRRQGRKTRTIVDTPDTIISHKVEKNQRSSVGSFENPTALLDTQESARKESVPATEIDDIVCAICRSDASPDEDPIVLCDGSGGSTAVCDLAVHATCYSATIDFNKEWRCDVCLYRFNGGTNQVRCLVCSKHTGALKRLDGDDWIHSDCRNEDPPTTTTTAASSKPRLKKIGRTRDVSAAREKQETGKKRTALSDVPVNVKKPAIAANKKKQRRDYCRFLDDEASIDSGDDIDGDEDEDDLLAIEGEEGKYDSFINDSSQLGEYTQDELDKVDSNDLHGDVDDDGEGATHRAVDAERERMNAFATPLLNRRQQQQSTDSSASVPSSERGLGKLHFIRSVMEHHRQGGRAEDIEQLFEELADGEEETQVDDD